MASHDDAALNLNCERCVRVYHAIVHRGGASWQNQIMRDTGMTRTSVKRHLKRLMGFKLVEEGIFGYRLPTLGHK